MRLQMGWNDEIADCATWNNNFSDAISVTPSQADTLGYVYPFIHINRCALGVFKYFRDEKIQREPLPTLAMCADWTVDL